MILEAWGMRTSGRSLGDPLKLMNKSARSGDMQGMDDEAQAVYYLERTPGFAKAKPVIRHVHILALPIESFRINAPGESVLDAINRLGWEGASAKGAAESVYQEFCNELADRARTDPFIPFRDYVEND